MIKTPIKSTQRAYEMIRAYFSKPGAVRATGMVTDTESNREPFEGCMYRTPEGRKCAVGCLIPDGLYDSDMENRTASEVKHWGTLDEYLANVDGEFLEAAQYAHDHESHSAEEFVHRLDEVAEARGYRVPA